MLVIHMQREEIKIDREKLGSSGVTMLENPGCHSAKNLSAMMLATFLDLICHFLRMAEPLPLSSNRFRM